MSMVCWFAMPDGLKLVVKDLRQFGLLVVGKYSRQLGNFLVYLVFLQV
jgi:hypothetical protein